MIIHRSDMKIEQKNKMRGGEGTVEITHLALKEEMDHCRLMAEISIPADAGIGEHQHNKETEYYIILEGDGVVADDGVDKNVSAGDVVVTGDGASHNIKNTGKSPLKMIAVILLED